MNTPPLFVKTLGSALIALTISVTSILAQAPAKKPTPKPLPPGPLPAAAPDFSQWQVTEKTDTVNVDTNGTNASATNSPGAAPATATPGGEQAATTPGGEEATNTPPPLSEKTNMVTKTKPICHEEEIGSKGVERWYTESMCIVVPIGGAPALSISSRGTGSAADFPDLSWISPSNYVDTIPYMGRDALLFKSSVEGNEVKACLDAKTRLPLIYESSSADAGMHTVKTYTWHPAPTAKLILPPNVQALVDKWGKALKKVNRGPVTQ